MTNSSIPFISDWEGREAFSDIGRNHSIHDPLKMLEGWSARLEGLEAQVGAKNLIDAGLLTLLARYKRCVCKINCTGTDYAGRTGSWTGTGFLVGRNLLMTNNHVLHNATAASNAVADFEYERSPGQLQRNIVNIPSSKRTFKLDPARLFITSPAIGGLDFTLVWIAEEASNSYGFVPISRGSFIPAIYDPVFIIHHPNGAVKQASVDDTELLNINSTTILYAADTESGSSGAPVFNRRGQLIGLHHSYRTLDGKSSKDHANRADSLQDGKTYRLANEGIKMSAIAVHLEEKLGKVGPDTAMVEEALDHFSGSDTLTGPFGARGRTVESKNRQDPSKVVDLYNSTEQDLDIASWNVEWLNDQYEDPLQMERAVTIMADMTMDVWILNGIVPEAASKLISLMKKNFNQKYVIEFTTDDPEYSRPATAIMYNPKTVAVERKPWPSQIKRIFQTNAKTDLKLSTLYGPVFPRFPACFNFISKCNSKSLNLNLVPLHVGETGNATLRNVLASRLLAQIVEKMTENWDQTTDWLISGDANTPFRHSQLRALEKKHVTPIVIKDEHNGGISYLRNKHSLLSNIFVTQDMQPVGDDHGTVVVSSSKASSKFIAEVAGNAPMIFRLSLYDEVTSNDIRQADCELPDYFRNKLETKIGGLESESDLAGWAWQGLDKLEFMTKNKNRFVSLLAKVNDKIGEQYANNAINLTLLDLWVIVYCEAGLKGGHINPHAVHSLDEVGLLPLPENIKYWNGSDAPAWNQPMSLGTNLMQYALYLAQLKNKHVRNTNFGVLYTDLFRDVKISNSSVSQAKLLAGIVHGYLVSQNYKNGKKPDISTILSGYGDDLPVQQILAGSGYVYDGSSILSNRQANIEAAVKGYLQTQPGLF